MKIILGSKNPAKLEAVRLAFSRFFPNENVIEVEGQSAPSGVSDQPMSHEETVTGAINRALYCKGHYEGDFFVGLEGGIAEFPATKELCLTSWAVLVAKDNERIGKGGGEMLVLPLELCELLSQYKELAPAADIYFKKYNVRENEGTVGALTKGLVSRSQWFEKALILALASFENK